MKRVPKYILSSLILLTLTVPELCAKRISPEDAKQKAQMILTKSSVYGRTKGRATLSELPTLTLSHTVTDSHATPIYYIFSKGEDKGFVIASADDRAVPILGYTDKGTFKSIDDFPEALKGWLKSYELTASKLSSAGMSPSGTYSITKMRNEIEPMVELFWGQDAPLNAKCPIVDGERAPVGCVGLAMAMVMAFHQYPDQGQGAVSYVNTANKQTITYDFEKTKFDFANLQPYYDGYEDTEEIDAVAELCFAAGASVKSEYKSTATGADVSAAVFNTYFKYPSEGMALLSRSYFTPEEWEDMVYEELSNNRPVLYRGGGTLGTGGHAFVIDGYEEASGLFHINWGWYGDADGYYNLNILRPSESGTGSNGDNVYSVDQQIVRGLRAPDGAVPTPIFTAEGVSFAKDTQEFYIDKLYCRGGQNVLHPGVEAIHIQTGNIYEIESIEKNPLTIRDDVNGGVKRLSITFRPDFSQLPDGEYVLRPCAKLTEDRTLNPGGYFDFYPIYCTLVNSRFIKAAIINGAVVEAECGSDVNHDIEFTNFQTSTSLITGSNRAFTMDAVNRGNTIIRSVRVWVYEHDADELAWPTGERSEIVLEPGNNGRFNLAIPNMTNLGGTFDLQVKNTEDTTVNYSKRIPFELVNSSNGVTIDGFKYVVISEKDRTAAVIRTNTSHTGEVIFQGTVKIKENEYILTELSNAILISNGGVTKVVVPPTVKRIAGSSFNGCSSLAEINLPEELEFLGGGCFMGCKALTAISIPKTITSIGDKTFSSAGLTSVELPEGLTSIGQYAFYGCKLTKLILPSTVESIGRYAFDNDNISIVICKSLTPPTIEDNTFYSQIYKNATLFVPAEAIDSYRNAPGWKSFKNCYTINEDKYAKVGDFWYELTPDFEAYIIPAMENETYSITKVTVPDKINYAGIDYAVTEVRDSAFIGHGAITSFSGGGNLRKIGNHAFENTGISSVSLADGITEIGDYAFFNSNIGSLSKLPANLTRIGEGAFAGNKRMSFYKSLNSPNNWLALPTSLQSIGDRAFEGCESLDKVQINGTIEYGTGVFDGCNSLSSIYLADTAVTPENVKLLASDIPTAHFYIERSNREYFVRAFDNPSRLYDLLTVKSVTWDGKPDIEGLTDVTITFDSKQGNPTTTTFIVKNAMFKDIATVHPKSSEDYPATGAITLTFAPFSLGAGVAQVSFEQPGFSEMIDINIVKTAALIESITLSETEKSLVPNETFALIASYSPDELDNDTLLWSSSDNSVATVDNSGNVIALANGTATITCKALMGIASAKCTVTVKTDRHPGKALDDGSDEITVADVNAIASHLMGLDVEGFNVINADANQDGRVTISDVTTAVKMILYSGKEATYRDAVDGLYWSKSNENSAVLLFDDINIGPSDSTYIAARLNADGEYSAIQADIVCPDGVKITDVILSEMLNAHSMMWTNIDENTTRIVIYSFVNEILPSNEGNELIVLKLAASQPVYGALSVEHGWAATPSAYKIPVSSMSYSEGGPAVLANVIPDGGAVNVYNIFGVLIKRDVKVSEIESKLAPGIYIVVKDNKSYKVRIK